LKKFIFVHTQTQLLEEEEKR